VDILFKEKRRNGIRKPKSRFKIFTSNGKEFTAIAGFKWSSFDNLALI
jgi:hypothetical protein